MKQGLMLTKPLVNICYYFSLSFTVLQQFGYGDGAL